MASPRLPRAAGDRTSSATTTNAAVAPALPRFNVFGYFDAASGLGAAARGYVRAFEHLSATCRLSNLSAAAKAETRDSKDGDINLVCASYQHFAAPVTIESFPRNRYTIGVWAWELPRFPAKLHEYFNYYDEIWVGSSFVADALSPVSPIPVVRIPPVLTPSSGASRERGREHIQARDDDFVFSFVFDFASHVERKNPRAVIDAFARAFKRDERAMLIIKCLNAEFCPAGYDDIVRAARDLRVQIICEEWPSQWIRNLTAASDAYVSLHRSEGTGLTISDAMALGKPVIATGWSGNMDFMNVSNSFPVRFDLATLSCNIGPYPAGQQWAEPSVEHAAQLMRHVYEHRDEARSCGEAARRDIEANYSESVVAQAITARLEAIRSHGEAALTARLARPATDSHAEYRRLVAQIHEIIDRSLPQDAKVLVVSKGDEHLLDLGIRRRAWHYPQTHGEKYAGCYPADGEAAVAHLETLRRLLGATHLLLPRVAFWWLEHYPALASHLIARYNRVWDDERCIVWSLSPVNPS